jgi:hypothetical protein
VGIFLAASTQRDLLEADVAEATVPLAQQDIAFVRVETGREAIDQNVSYRSN